MTLSRKESHVFLVYLNLPNPIPSSYLGQHKVAIVCSARSGTTKALGTTNLLLRAASEALQRNGSSSNGKATSGTMTPVTPGWMPMGRTSEPTSPPGSPPLNGVDQDSSTSPGSPSPFGIGMTFGGGAATPAFSATVDLIRNEHLAAAQANVQSKHILRQLEAEIERDCEALRGFLFATQVIDEISPRSRDSIVGFGERLSCKIMAAVLRDQGVDAEYVSLENIVPVVAGETAGSEGILDQDFYDRVGQAVSERIQQCGPRVPVITGFFGPVPGSLLRQIGRGYTDLLAALLAAAIPAAELQIWKEVDGIFTADPRKVPTARLIPVISPEEASELTYYGSEVVHPFSMEQVIRKKIPIRIKNVENPTGGGTVIHPDPEHIANLSGDGDEWDNSLLLHSPPTDEAAEAALTPPASRSPIAKRAAAAAAAAKSRPKLPTAVTIKDRIVVLNIHSNRKSVSHGFLAGIFSTLDRFGVVVDLISTSEVHVSMAIEGSGLGDSGGVDKRLLERLLKELRKIGSVRRITLHACCV
jgi:aspartate kinase